MSLANQVQVVRKVRDFMIGDLEKTIKMATTKEGAPNFMIALALSAYTEYWGRFVEGISSGDSERCYKAFFRKLGKSYDNLLNRSELVDGKGKSLVYRDVRCGLIHAYLIEGNAEVNLGTGSCGVEYDANTKKYTFSIVTYFEDFSKAVDSYLAGIASGTEDAKKFQDALAGKPILV